MRLGRAALGPALALVLVLAETGLIAGASGRAVGASGPRPSPAALPAVPAAAAATGLSGTDASVAGRVAVSPVIVRLELVPRKPRSKSPLQVRVVVTNLSATRVAQVVVDLAATPALAVRPDPKVLRGLAPSRSAGATWSLCSTTAMSVRLVARATVGPTTASSAPLEVRLPASGRC